MEPGVVDEAAAPARVFANQEAAARAVEALRAAGFSPDEIGVVARGAAEEDAPMDAMTETEEIAGDVAAGAVEGGVLGAALGLFAGAFLIPGVGPIVAGGALAAAFTTAGSAALAGVGLGAAAGGIVGVLRGEGFTERRAHHLARGVEEGGTLVTVAPGPRAAEAAGILEASDGQ